MGIAASHHRLPSSFLYSSISSSIDCFSSFDPCLLLCCSIRTSSNPSDRTLSATSSPPHDTRRTRKMASAIKSALPSRLKPGDHNDGEEQPERHHGKSRSHMAFENTSTNVAAAQMRNHLTHLAESVKDAEQKKLFETEMDNFFALFRRYLNDKAKGNSVDWDRIAPPAQGQVVDYDDLANSESVQLQMSAARFGDAPLIKLGGDFKKVSDFQKRIPSIPKVLELDHLTITGAVN